MYSILVADDERIEREGIKSLLKQCGLDLEIQEASNGKKALEYLEKHNADILITDIKMPFMDGMELIENVRKQFPKMQIIIFSGYGEFDYARTAIRLGVSDYILKPVNPEDFYKTIEKVIAEIQKDNSEMDSIQKKKGFLEEHFLLLLLNGAGRESLEQKAESLLNLSYLENYKRMIILEFNGNFFGRTGFQFEDKLREELKVSFTYLNMDEEQSILLLPKDRPLDYRVLAEHIHRYIKETWHEECYVAVSSPWGKDSISQIPQKYASLERLMEDKFYDRERYILLEEDGKNGELSGAAPDEKLTVLISEAIHNKDVYGLKKHFDLLCQNYQEKNDFSQMYVKFIFSNINKEIILLMKKGDERELNEVIDKIYRSNDIGLIIQYTNENIEKLEGYLNKTGKGVRSEVETVKQYIYENYDKDISIDGLADQVCLAPSYLSFIFKKETGQNLSKYIKEYRMEKAKKLLRGSHEKIVSISQSVGYSNVSYFCQSFREYYGVSPEKYRKSGEAYEQDTAVF